MDLMDSDSRRNEENANLWILKQGGKLKIGFGRPITRAEGLIFDLEDQLSKRKA
ncbi:MAG: hypothetical protein GY940_29705 [bacterium]|nr:hypothetical protein [bacterium]